MTELVFLRSKAYAFKYSRMTETAPAVASCQAVSTGVDSVIRPAAKVSRMTETASRMTESTPVDTPAVASTEDEVKKIERYYKVNN